MPDSDRNSQSQFHFSAWYLFSWCNSNPVLTTIQSIQGQQCMYCSFHHRNSF